jgi:hypothetical protein
MKAQTCPEIEQEFEEDSYIEELISLRDSGSAVYHMSPQAVKEVVAQYEREKGEALKERVKQK